MTVSDLLHALSSAAGISSESLSSKFSKHTDAAFDLFNVFPKLNRGFHPRLSLSPKINHPMLRQPWVYLVATP